MRQQSEMLVKIVIAYEDTELTERAAQDLFLELVELVNHEFGPRLCPRLLSMEHTQIVEGLVDHDGVAVQPPVRVWPQ